MFRSNENCFGVFPFNKCRWCFFYSRPRLELIQSNWERLKERTIVNSTRKHIHAHKRPTTYYTTPTHTPNPQKCFCLILYVSLFFQKKNEKKWKMRREYFVTDFFVFLGEKINQIFENLVFGRTFFPLWFLVW